MPSCHQMADGDGRPRSYPLPVNAQPWVQTRSAELAELAAAWREPVLDGHKDTRSAVSRMTSRAPARYGGLNPSYRTAGPDSARRSPMDVTALLQQLGGCCRYGGERGDPCVRRRRGASCSKRQPHLARPAGRAVPDRPSDLPGAACRALVGSHRVDHPGRRAGKDPRCLVVDSSVRPTAQRGCPADHRLRPVAPSLACSPSPTTSSVPMQRPSS